VLLDHFPSLAHSGPDIDLVLVIQQPLEGFFGVGTEGVIQTEDGVIHVEEYFHLRR
jgi:hypothetical protein